jgi:hypothetical protein
MSGSYVSLPKPFHFEAFWTKDGSNTYVVQNARNCVSFGSPLYQFVQKKSKPKKESYLVEKKFL